MERRMRGNSHVRCGAGEKSEIVSKIYLSLSDPMQAELILYLTGEHDDIHWHNCKPIPGSLFVVGDPKQSIYRFRRADITIYNQVKEIIKNNGEVIYLDINFRSSDNVCNWVESTFKKKNEDLFGFEEDATNIQAGFKNILSLWDDFLQGEDKSINGIYQYNYPESQEPEYVANIVEDILESYVITEKVKKLKDGIKNGEKDYYNVNRKVKEGDIMILTKTNEETGLYLKALKNKGISALLAGEKNLGDTREILNLFILIDALVDYRDNVKLVSVLRNSFYLELETINLFMEKYRDLSQFIFSKNKIDKIQHPSIKKAFLYLNDLANLSKELRPIPFIERIIENQIGVYDIHREYTNIEIRDAESALGQTIEILKSKSCGSIYELREELKNLISTKVNYELPINKKEAENAIRIMNIHKSKGLEANIVILVGGDKKKSILSNTHYVEKDNEGNSIGFIAYSKNHNIIGPKEMERKEVEKLFKEAEIDRLLYVAATRAKSTLIVSNAMEEKNFLYPLSNNIENEIKSEKRIENIKREIKLSKEKRKEIQITKELIRLKEISSPSYFKITPSEFERVKDIKDEVNFMEKTIIYRSPKFQSTRISKSKFIPYSPRGKGYGIIIHRAMEILIKNSKNFNDINNNIIDYAVKVSVNENIDNLEINRTNIGLFYPSMDLAVSAIMEKENNEARLIIKRRVYKYVKRVLNNFINNEDIIEIFRNSDKVFSELSFTMAIDKKDREILWKLSNLIPREQIMMVKKYNKIILINGVMDLVIKSKDGSWTIIDYKTDICFNREILRRNYNAQLEGYGILFEEIMKDEDIKVDNLLLYSTFNDELIDIYSKILV
ncbi:3'-5' exonuclease [Tissierella praeacuta]|uniref:UvrD-helicase domain-containing protein n=1 Tax=Tissierella praeacuta TaxID=43131 RepID=UPI003342A9AA